MPTLASLILFASLIAFSPKTFAYDYICKQFKKGDQTQEINFIKSNYPNDLKELLVDSKDIGNVTIRLKREDFSGRIVTEQSYSVESNNRDWLHLSQSPGGKGRWYRLGGNLNYEFEIPSYFENPVTIFKGTITVSRVTTSPIKNRDGFFSQHFHEYNGPAVFFRKGSVGLIVQVMDDHTNDQFVKDSPKPSDVDDFDLSITENFKISKLNVFACYSDKIQDDFDLIANLTDLRDLVYKEVSRNGFIIQNQESMEDSFDSIETFDEYTPFDGDNSDGGSKIGKATITTRAAIAGTSAAVTGGVYLGYKGLQKIRIPRGRAAALGTLLGIGITAPALAKDEADSDLQYQDIELD